MSRIRLDMGCKPRAKGSTSAADDRTTFLRWEGTIEGHKLESLEVIVDNEQG